MPLPLPVSFIRNLPPNLPTVWRICNLPPPPSSAWEVFVNWASRTGARVGEIDIKLPNGAMIGLKNACVTLSQLEVSVYLGLTFIAIMYKTFGGNNTGNRIENGRGQPNRAAAAAAAAASAGVEIPEQPARGPNLNEEASNDPDLERTDD